MKAFPRDIEIQNLKERHIGVESELLVKNSPYQSVPEKTQAKLNEKGLLQSIGSDGGGREFRTNPISIKSLLKQVRGRKYFSEYYAELSVKTQVVESGGTHIHISILDSDHENMEANAMALASAFFKQFQKIAGRKSHWAGHPMARFGMRNFDDIKKYIKDRSFFVIYDKEHYDRPYLANIRAYSMKGSILGPTRHKTLEFRGPVGSNNADEILVWIEFLNNVVKTANQQSIDGVKFGDLVSTDRVAAYMNQLDGWRKIGKRELNKKVNIKALVYDKV